MVFYIGIVDGKCAVNGDAVCGCEESYIIDKTKDYHLLVSDQWSGVICGETVVSISSPITVNVLKNKVADRLQKNIVSKSLKREYLVSSELGLLDMHSDKTYHVIALRRIII